MCTRRPGLAVALDADDGLLLADLEPDGLWPIYRRYRLLIVGQRDDEIASAFARSVVDVLARALPTSRAQLARAADMRRVGVLIGTNQQDVAIMAADSAEALFLAKPPFDDIRNVPLRVIVSFGSHVLVCRADFMAATLTSWRRRWPSTKTHYPHLPVLRGSCPGAPRIARLFRRPRDARDIGSHGPAFVLLTLGVNHGDSNNEHDRRKRQFFAAGSIAPHLHG